MNNKLYSVRMRASVKSRHISGAERIVSREKIDNVMRDFLARAMNRGAAPEHILMKIEDLGDGPFRTLTALDVITINVQNVQIGRSIATRVLHRAGVSVVAAASAIQSLAAGPAPSGKTMRGAMIIDAQSGERLEQNRERGVRASRFDWSESASSEIDRRLADAGLTHFRTREALALATKVAHAPGIVAELCWSDDPDYTTGYIASLQHGYVRVPRLKNQGDPKGGRVFFVDRDTLKMNVLTHYLQMEAVLITGVGEMSGVVEPDRYFS